MEFILANIPDELQPMRTRQGWSRGRGEEGGPPVDEEDDSPRALEMIFDFNGVIDVRSLFIFVLARDE